MDDVEDELDDDDEDELEDEDIDDTEDDELDVIATVLEELEVNIWVLSDDAEL